jgi:type IX secretion system PorP/SprF family membrane protein
MKRLIYLFLILFCIDLYSQTMPSVSQFDNDQVHINPATVGNKDALVVAFKLRKNWVGMDGAPSSQIFTAHAPLRNPNVALGLLLENENVGVTNYTGIYLNYAYRVPLHNGKLSFGLKGGITAVSQSIVDLRDEENPDPAFSDKTTNFILPNCGFGIYYYSTKYWVGFSIPRFFGFESNESGSYKLVNDISRYEYYLTTGGKIELTSAVHLEPSAMLVLSTVFKPEITLNCVGVFRNSLKGGVGYRTNDAIIIMIGYNINRQFSLAYSYDINIGQLSNYNSGSHEIGVQYKFGYTVNASSPRHF